MALSIVAMAKLEINILTHLAKIKLGLEIEDSESEYINDLYMDAKAEGFNSEDGINYYSNLQISESFRHDLVSAFNSGYLDRLEYDANNRSVKQLEKEWKELNDDERNAIFDDFQMACIDGSREPSGYWYNLLMPRMMQGYVGD